VAASSVSHFDPDVISELRGRLGPALARQELDAEFVASLASVFSAETLDSMFAPVDEFGTGEDEFDEQEAELDYKIKIDSRKRFGI
jgi:hypothetical protein